MVTSIHHTLTLFDRHRHRFFAEDMLAGLCCAEGLFAVEVWVCCDVNCIEFVICQKIVYVGINPFRTVSFGEVFRFSTVPPHHSDEFRIIDTVKGWSSFIFSDISTTEYAPSERCHVICSFLNSECGIAVSIPRSLGCVNCGSAL